MAAVTFTEKDSDPLSFFTENAVIQRIANTYVGFLERREALGLSNPGTIDGIAKEVQRDVFLNNHSFSGLRADITKAFSVAPMFQISHSLSMGSQALNPYSFAALYGSPKVFCQANVDNDFGLIGRFNWRWTSALVTKTSVQLAPGPGQSMFSMEQDYTGADFTASVKAMNPSILEGGLTGIFIGDYLQSITPRLALGLNAMWQRAAMNTGPDTLVSYAARYKGDDWIASGQLVAAGGLQLSYWRRLAEKVEGGVDVNLQVAPGAGGGMMGGPLKKEGTTTIGAKYNFRASSFRAQLDSQGRLGCLFEKHIAPAVSVTFSGEIDHVKSTSKIGLAISIENAPEEFVEQQEQAAGMQPPPF
ncbi:hypothetical protein BLS_005626 [Venturia inaequalis]|uniref:Translocase of outer membrane 40 kDa subunit n=1 Tax=Venturia inaequalis TaxID=5025 RepID=A0A8H3YSX9_VENIN|nr:hypothetical protein BLS_005626 [Venturia inaequalis]KAE9982470.1 hypothetical protein EG328_010860 [Venturia inaequalis]KAE9989652.1 hypothetical protein EG327_002415 [Venturia inaequalis]RDI76386.1 hypothetical protein Vi05172_g13600 [Venturia inaequalis]